MLAPSGPQVGSRTSSRARTASRPSLLKPMRLISACCAQAEQAWPGIAGLRSRRHGADLDEAEAEPNSPGAPRHSCRSLQRAQRMRQLEAAERGRQPRRGWRRDGARRPRRSAHSASPCAVSGGSRWSTGQHRATQFASGIKASPDDHGAARGVIGPEQAERTVGTGAPAAGCRASSTGIDYNFTAAGRRANMRPIQADRRLNQHDGDRQSLGAGRGPDAHRRVLRDRRQGRRRAGADQRRTPAFTIVGLPDKAIADRASGAQRARRDGPACRPSASPSIWRRPIWPRRAATSICRSRSRCWSAWAPCRGRPRAIWRSASWRWMARSCASPACCLRRSPPRRASSA